MDEAFDADTFMLGRTVFVLVNIEGHRQRGLERSIITFNQKDGKVFLLFTDRDLALKLSEEAPLPGTGPVEIQTHKALHDLLENFERIGIQHVGIDVSANRKGRFYPIREIIDAIKRNPIDLAGIPYETFLFAPTSYSIGLDPTPIPILQRNSERAT